MSRLKITTDNLSELTEQTETAIEQARAVLEELPDYKDDELLEYLVEELEEYRGYWHDARSGGAVETALEAARSWLPLLHAPLRQFVARVAVLEDNVSEPVPLDVFSPAQAEDLLEGYIDCPRVIGLCPNDHVGEVSESAPPGWVRTDIGFNLAAHPDRFLFERARWSDVPLGWGLVIYDVASFDAYLAALVGLGRLDPDGPSRAHILEAMAFDRAELESVGPEAGRLLKAWSLQGAPDFSGTALRIDELAERLPSHAPLDLLPTSWAPVDPRDADEIRYAAWQGWLVRDFFARQQHLGRESFAEGSWEWAGPDAFLLASQGKRLSEEEARARFPDAFDEAE